MADKKKIAVEAFENNDALETVYVSKDGQPFGVISDIQNHVAKFKTPEDKKYDTFTREELKVKQTKRDRNRVIDAVAAIKAADTVEKVKELTAKEIRPFVLAQAKIRLKELGVEDKNSENSSKELETLREQNSTLAQEKAAALQLAKDNEKKAADAEKLAKTATKRAEAAEGKLKKN